MPRPKPEPEDLPIPRSVSFLFKHFVASRKFIAAKPELRLKDRSDLVNTAMAEYIERHYPGLIAKVAADIRAGAHDVDAPEAGLFLRAVAESGQAAYENARDQPSALARRRGKGGSGRGKKSGS